MRRPFPVLALAAVLGLAASPALACLWDYDTLQMERRQFPDALELITGRFLRHGEAFYRWRIEDRTARLAKTPEDLALHDDLAVAYDKVGESRKAIEIMLAKAKLRAGLYETEANLGTFYIHAGDYEQGLVHIGRAIQINPEAHFGREIYQKLLVEYVLTKREDGELVLPMRRTEGRNRGHEGFADFVLERRKVMEKEPVEGEDPWAIEMAAALKGVLGMMRFGHHDSPVLLEALGDLLLAGKGEGGKRLACRAYLKAALETQGGVRAAYRARATASLDMQTVHGGTTETLTVQQVEQTLREELEAAEAWYAQVLADEQRWIERGENPETKFDEKYYGVAPPDEPAAPAEPSAGGSKTLIIVGLVVLVLLNLSVFLMRRRR